MKVRRLSYKGWKNCYQISNRILELLVTADVGPRIISFGFKGGTNVFWVNKKFLGKSRSKQWTHYGGHRLWHAPESMPRTYSPDNMPVKVEKSKNLIRFIQSVEKDTGIQKEIAIKLSNDENPAEVKIIHRLRNTNSWPIELAPWALSVMGPGGKAIIPLPPRGSHSNPDNLLPVNLIALWPYTNMQDPRWSWGKRYIMLQQDGTQSEPQKVGVGVKDGWIAYANHGHLFVKKFYYDQEARYPDFGCPVETFTNADMLEVETLGPLAYLKPGSCAEHQERWFLFKNVPVPLDDNDVDQYILPKIHSVE